MVSMLVLVSQVLGVILIAVAVVKIVMKAGAGSGEDLTLHSSHHRRQCHEAQTELQHCQHPLLSIACDLNCTFLMFHLFELSYLVLVAAKCETRDAVCTV